MSGMNGDFEEVLLRFDMHHEMMYHEMCDVVATLRAENERLKDALAGSPLSPPSPEFIARWAAATTGETT